MIAAQRGRDGERRAAVLEGPRPKMLNSAG